MGNFSPPKFHQYSSCGRKNTFLNYVLKFKPFLTLVFYYLLWWKMSLNLVFIEHKNELNLVSGVVEFTVASLLVDHKY